MPNFINLTGQTFGRLTIIERAENAKNKATRWKSVCKCGNKIVVLASSLRSGRTKSCGCLNSETTAKRNFLHGMSHSSEHNIWWAMIQRCYNPNNNAFDRYGGRGVTVCNEWRDNFMAFFNHVGPRPSSKYSIDRVDNDGNYEPNNVRWATRKQQADNKRNNHLIMFNGRLKNLTQWAKIVGVNKKTLFNRINTLNWPIEKALTKPINRRLKG